MSSIFRKNMRHDARFLCVFTLSVVRYVAVSGYRQRISEVRGRHVEQNRPRVLDAGETFARVPHQLTAVFTRGDESAFHQDWLR